MIVALDGGPVAERALPVAAALAARATIPMTLVTVVSKGDLEDNASSYLAARAAELPGLQVDKQVLWGMPVAETLIEYLGYRRDSMVCLSTHARLNSRNFMLGSVAEELVRHGPLPVVLVGPSADFPAPDGGYQEVVVGVEDESAHRLVPSICDLSRTFGLRPVLLGVTAPSYGAVRTKEDAPEGALLECLKQALADHGTEVEGDLVEDRNVPLALTTFARQRSAPILTLSSRRRYPEERYEQASVTVAVARIATCPVLVVGPGVPVGHPTASE